mmetsp:Transcript_9353/g.31284  ORF Transcript_9353/g.31284 Transcript_9353/m.31284 type:complete len:231 (-) Transcript_9353:287-979(-)
MTDPVMDCEAGSTHSRTITAWKEFELPADNKIDRLDVESKTLLLDSISKRMFLNRNRDCADSRNAEVREREASLQYNSNQCLLQQAQTELQEEFVKATKIFKESYHNEISKGCSMIHEREELDKDPNRGLVGLDVPIRVGLRVKPAHSGGFFQYLSESDGNLGSVMAQNLQGFITRMNDDKNACWVKWDNQPEECGWYRCGIYSRYALQSISEKDQIRSHVNLCFADRLY